jgi:hypothetical protein
MADKDILIIKVNLLVSNDDFEHIRTYINESKKTGIIILPHYCDVIMVPKDVEIKAESSDTAH